MLADTDILSDEEIIFLYESKQIKFTKKYEDLYCENYKIKQKNSDNN